MSSREEPLASIPSDTKFIKKINEKDDLKLKEQKRGGYGIVYQNVMRNKSLSPEAKAIYAYLSSIAGSGGSCYPSVDTIQKELCMSKNRLSKHMRQLISLGVVEKVRERNGNIYGRNVYKITHRITLTNDLKHIFEVVENEAVEIQALENKTTNNNNTNNNNTNNNNINYQQIADMYNEICISFPHLTKLSDARKKAIKARLKQYRVEDFKKLFEMAEKSRFLKGQNNRNWSANFDWLIKDANMAKVLDGNYTDIQTTQLEPRGGGKTQYKSYEAFERELRAALGQEGIV